MPCGDHCAGRSRSCVEARDSGAQVAGPGETRDMRIITAVTIAALLVTPVLAGCGSRGQTPTRSSSSTGAPGDPDPASAILALAPTVPGAARASGLPDPIFGRPAQQPACQPLDVRTAYWTSDWAGPAVVKYLTTHPGPHFQVSGSGTTTGPGGVTSLSVVFDPKSGATGTHSGPGLAMLVYEIAPLAKGVGIRADAEVVPANATCTTS